MSKYLVKLEINPGFASPQQRSYFAGVLIELFEKYGYYELIEESTPDSCKTMFVVETLSPQDFHDYVKKHIPDRTVSTKWIKVTDEVWELEI